MINVIAIHMEVDGSNHLEHIGKLRWIKADEAGQHTTGNSQEAMRAEMYKFVKENPKQAYAISQNDNTYAFLEAVNAHVQYVKTTPDSTRSDNLLSLSRY
jgi:Protein of unknown function (DUF3892)